MQQNMCPSCPQEGLKNLDTCLQGMRIQLNLLVFDLIALEMKAQAEVAGRNYTDKQEKLTIPVDRAGEKMSTSCPYQHSVLFRQD